MQQGRYVPLEGVVRDALRRYPGQLLEVELDDGVYEVEILRTELEMAMALLGAPTIAHLTRDLVAR